MSVDYPAHLEAIADAVREGACLLFLGAGVHAPPPEGSAFEYPEDARPPLASALSESLATASRLTARHPRENPTDLRRVALFYEVERGRRDLEEHIRRAVHVGKEPSPVVRALAELGFPLVVTTNYEQLFENALVAAGRNPRVFIYGVDFEGARGERRGLLRTYERFGNPTPESPVVVKVHGDINHRETIVVTDEDYIKLSNHISGLAEYFRFLRHETSRWTTLIVGYSMLDYDFRQVFTLYMEQDRYRFAPMYSVDYAPDALLSELWERQRRMNYIRSNVWDFVPELYRLVLGKEMPNYSSQVST
jgi:hypothetical protein